MHIRLWFRTKLSGEPPRVLAHGSGLTMKSAMLSCFAPVGNPGWTYREIDGRGHLRRGAEASYMGEDTDQEQRHELCQLEALSALAATGNGRLERHNHPALQNLRERPSKRRRQLLIVEEEAPPKRKRERVEIEPARVERKKRKRICIPL